MRDIQRRWFLSAITAALAGLARPAWGHHDQDELWYVLAGEYVVEIGSGRHELKPGDCILGPRRIPHAWAFIGDSPGRLLIAFTPAEMQENFERDRRAGEYRSDAEVFRAYGMELVGPPLSIK